MKLSTFLVATYLSIAPRTLPAKIEGGAAEMAYRLIVLSLLLVLRKTQYWPQHQLHALQRLRLNYLLRRAHQCPFWKRRLSGKAHLTSLDELSSLPLLTKEELVASPKETLITSRSADFNLLASNRTSGTSGRIIEVFFDPRQFYLAGAAYFFRSFLRHDASFRQLVALFRSVPWLIHLLAFRANELKLVSHEVFLPLVASEERLREIYRVLSAERIFSVLTLPSTLFQLAEFMRRQGLSPVSPRLFIVASGERLHPDQKKFLEETIGCTIRCRYGMREMFFIGLECEWNPGRYHISAERIIVEIIDSGGQVLPADREGEIVLTCLDNLFMPLIRYRTGDAGKIIGGLCRCHKTLPLLEVHGRAIQFIRLRDGNTMSPLQLQLLLLEGEGADYIVQYQIRQVALDMLRIAVVLKRTDRRVDTILMDIRRKAEALLNHLMQVTIETTKSIPPTASGKFQDFIPLPTETEKTPA